MTSDSKGQDMQVQFFPISLQHTRDISGVHFFFWSLTVTLILKATLLIWTAFTNIRYLKRYLLHLTQFTLTSTLHTYKFLTHSLRVYFCILQGSLIACGLQ